ncbi:MAG: hypothetical protein Q7J42_04995 [Sulfuritalea sp.]|nr:hypothetical protein [Sulfuritalea sp.]
MTAVKSPQPYLSQANCVATFAIDKDIRHRSREIEHAFSAVVGGQANSTNVPDSMAPPIPRFAMQGGPKKISISQVTAQLDMSFDDKSRSLKESFQTLKKNSDLFWKGICKLVPHNDRKDYGVIVAINFPVDQRSQDVAQAIFGKFLNAPTFGDVASCSIQMGFLATEKKLFRNISLGSYEIRKGLINSNPAVTEMQQVINFSEMDIEETGYEIKMDVNSRPRAVEGIPLTEGHGGEIIEELEALIFSDAAQFLKW